MGLRSAFSPKPFETCQEKHGPADNQRVADGHGKKIWHDAAQDNQNHGNELHHKIRQPEAKSFETPAVLNPQQGHNQSTDGVADNITDDNSFHVKEIHRAPRDFTEA